MGSFKRQKLNCCLKNKRTYFYKKRSKKSDVKKFEAPTKTVLYFGALVFISIFMFTPFFREYLRKYELRRLLDTNNQVVSYKIQDYESALVESFIVDINNLNIITSKFGAEGKNTQILSKQGNQFSGLPVLTDYDCNDYDIYLLKGFKAKGNFKFKNKQGNLVMSDTVFVVKNIALLSYTINFANKDLQNCTWVSDFYRIGIQGRLSDNLLVYCAMSEYDLFNLYEQGSEEFEQAFLTCQAYMQYNNINAENSEIFMKFKEIVSEGKTLDELSIIIGCDDFEVFKRI